MLLLLLVALLLPVVVMVVPPPKRKRMRRVTSSRLVSATALVLAAAAVVVVTASLALVREVRTASPAGGAAAAAAGAADRPGAHGRQQYTGGVDAAPASYADVAAAAAAKTTTSVAQSDSVGAPVAETAHDAADSDTQQLQLQPPKPPLSVPAPFARQQWQRSFGAGLSQSFCMILVTELGDKTFFIAAVMAMRHSRNVVLNGALSALVVMTVLSAILGRVFPVLFSPRYTSLAAAALFFFFGRQMLRDWWRMHRQHRSSQARRQQRRDGGGGGNAAAGDDDDNDDNDNDDGGDSERNAELHEVEEELREHGEIEKGEARSPPSPPPPPPTQYYRDGGGGEGARGKRAPRNASPGSCSNGNGQDEVNRGMAAVTGAVKRTLHRSERLMLTLVSPVFLRAFTLTFLAEWGDRSQIATIALAAQRDMNSVVVGAVAGHALCTGLAVVGGRLLATRIPEKTIALIGGVLFLVFGAVSLIAHV